MTTHVKNVKNVDEEHTMWNVCNMLSIWHGKCLLSYAKKFLPSLLHFLQFNAMIRLND